MGVTDALVAVGLMLYLTLAALCSIGTAAGLYAHRFWIRQARGSDVWLFAMSMRWLAGAVCFASCGFGLWVAWAVYLADIPLMLRTGWPLFIIWFGFELAYLFGLYMFLRFVQIIMWEDMPPAERPFWPWWLIWDYPERRFEKWYRATSRGFPRRNP